jgi:hypothetical protein
MEEITQTAPQNAASFIGRLVFSLWQVFFGAVVGLVALGMLGDREKLTAPNAPVTLFWVALAIGAATAVLLIATGLRKFHRTAVVVGYLGALGFIVLWLVTIGQVQAAWEQTPKGAAEAAWSRKADLERQAAEAQQARDDAAQKRAEEAAKQAADRLTEQQQRVEACFSTFGHRLPDFENAVKDALNNPNAYEHVKTVAMPTDADGYNVALTFRGQNGFGAIRTETIRATVNPDTCKVENIEPEPEML